MAEMMRMKDRSDAKELKYKQKQTKLQDEIEMLKKENQQINVNLQEKQKQLEEQEAAAAAAASKSRSPSPRPGSSALMAQLTDLQRRLGEAQTNIHMLENEVDDSNARAAANHDDYQVALEESRVASQEKNEALDRMRKLEQDILLYKSTTTQQTEENSRLKTKCKSLENDLVSLMEAEEEEKEALQKERHVSLMEIKRLQLECQEARDQLNDIRAEQQQGVTAFQDLHRELEEQRHESNKRQEEINTKNHEIVNIQQRLSQASENLKMQVMENKIYQ